MSTDFPEVQKRPEIIDDPEAEVLVNVEESEPTPVEKKDEKRRIERADVKRLGIFYRGSVADDVFCVFLLIWAVLAALYMAFVFPYLIFTQTTPYAPFNGLTFASVPFYTASMIAERSEVYKSVDFYVWMFDYLVALLPFYGVSVFFLVYRHQFTSVSLTLGIYIIAPIFAILQIAKALYFSIELAPGLCQNYQFCTAHNLGSPPTTPTIQFVVAVIFAWLQFLFILVLFAIPSIVSNGWRKAWNEIVNVDSKLPTPQQRLSATDIAFSIKDMRAVRRRGAPPQGTGSDIGSAPLVNSFFDSHGLDPTHKN